MNPMGFFPAATRLSFSRLTIPGVGVLASVFDDEGSLVRVLGLESGVGLGNKVAILKLVLSSGLEHDFSSGEELGFFPAATHLSFSRLTIPAAFADYHLRIRVEGLRCVVRFGAKGSRVWGLEVRA